VEEVSARLDALSTEDLREVRDYEERTKNRETVLEFDATTGGAV
jgi:hypothetical protein